MEKLLNFLDLLHQFQRVQRTIFANGEDRLENDAEHSYQLAMLGWYIIESGKLSYDVDKVVRYALVHDLVETYAGDTYFYTKDGKKRESKQAREHKAMLRIKKEFPEFPELVEWIAEYESKANPEAKFVYALDKLLPVLSIYEDGGKTWQEYKVTWKMLMSKDEKIRVNENIYAVWEDFLVLLRERKDELFHNDRPRAR